ncbi:hypothetical protein BQ8794_10431 [Mesorhizobium prunaredense]|uniref:Uncharacterized protein n=1 Tax=Mesorhizobium prunaredense TaxID=1631249 RepID=A0A1R3UZI8_9HYPH|nr:hypothetical protein BQ8794_10431 [Mesorhizobium prunaredense]
MLTRSIHRYPGEPASQKVILSAAAGSFCAKRSRICANSAAAAEASGGGGTRKSSPDVITHVFHVPASGSIKSDWAKAQFPEKRITAQALPKPLSMQASHRLPRPKTEGFPFSRPFLYFSEV